MTRPIRIGMTAGEASGDLLGAGLIQALRARLGDAVSFEGMAGPRMQAAGCRALFASERIAVMGLIEVLKHLPDILRVRRELKAHFLAQPPDVFIGIDSPDFNLGLERGLKRHGIRTLHYVSPTVWAWREGRIHTIARAVNRLLVLFPFEAELYRRHGVDAVYVGHPLADQLPLVPDASKQRQALGLPSSGPLLAVLPGSRRSELEQLAQPFAQTLDLLHRLRPDLHFVAPMATTATRGAFEQALAALPQALPITLLDGHSQAAMEAADVVLLASGTATLEAMLLKRPMVVAYKVAPLSYRLLRHLVRIDRFSLPNILAGDDLVEEYIQQAVQPQALARAVLTLIEDDTRRARLVERFTELHEMLRCNAAQRAAQAVLEVIGHAG